jgi:cytochrome oxidase Cu insertion factor (SCO1/SenC/PrrC family)
VLTLRRALLAAVLAVVALALLTPAARADGDPGSDVLVYQNLFVAADADIAVPQQVELGDLLSSAARAGLDIRVAVVARQDDLGAITALWQKPAAYASFLGVELSLAYTGRLLVVMPDGFGFYWHGHSASAADEVLGGMHIGPGGAGLATAAEAGVRALAQASGIRLAPASGTVASGTSGGAAAGTSSGTQPTVTAAPASHLALIAWLASGAFVVCAAVVTLALLRRPRVRPGLPPSRQPLRRLTNARRANLSLPRLSLPGLSLPGLSLPGLSLRPLRQAAGRRRRAIPGTWIAGGFAGVAALLIVVHAVVQPSSSAAQGSTTQASALTDNPSLDPGDPLTGTAPAFTLTDQFGQPVSLNSFRGKVVILAFNDAECTTICPLTTASLVQAKEMLGAAGSQVQLLGVDANPKATAVEDVMSYSQLHGMLYQWHYLTGSLAQLKQVWKDYSVGVTISQSQTDHEPAIFVINQQGKLAKLYLTQQSYSAVGQLGQLLASEVASLLPSHPVVDSHLSYAPISGISPATDTALPAAGGGYVSMGPGQSGQGSPRLYLFFATWDREITTLGGQLEALSAYQSAAGSAGLPGLTAVDEGSVEPSAAALPDFLATLPRPLAYPVAIDDSGQVADGYQVQGEPWFVLASSTGKVLWSWEVSTSGWPSTASLDQHVRAALAKAAG